MEDWEYPVFVYGTLKRGGSNHFLLEHGSQFLGIARTSSAYPLKIGKYPFLIDSKGEGFQVEGEVYRLSSKRILDALDELEDHPILYTRKLKPVKICNEKTMTAWVYFFNNPTESIQVLPNTPSFDPTQISYQ